MIRRDFLRFAKRLNERMTRCRICNSLDTRALARLLACLLARSHTAAHDHRISAAISPPHLHCGAAFFLRVAARKRADGRDAVRMRESE